MGRIPRIAIFGAYLDTEEKNCESRPAYIEGNYVHDFCGGRCRDAFQNGTSNPASPRASPAPVSRVCKLPKCQQPTFVGGDGMPSDYCSNAHRLEAVRSGKAEACLFCNKWPKSVINGKLSDFCSRRCSEDTFSSAPIILIVTHNMTSFRDVAKQFRDQWKHPTPKPTVVKIWKIYCDKDHTDQFSRYKLAIERKTNYTGGNSKRRWHGTIRTCTVGDSDGQMNLCSNVNCSLCSIIRTSFHLAKAGQRTNFGRFGAGIYTSATSSKANDYVDERGGSPYKAMLLSDVVMGKAVKMTTGDEDLTAPPTGYDSVVGEPGGDLNYDEAIVYKNEAIRPLFLVIYRH
ncbi:uncharacterized protein C8Q71DRAFT_862706 [Rhodofomes roseus]|uniref:PARP catalytic domain-containing protein n=1 Tax=Rhodofomes roseus TaxID=34475 RepID=A0ABQ8K1P1_9APHY|nr:uncharacterized protein C8Q71DRAFT_862706 [Rhodofomes roseus]KAH9830115.1 hypothetical protein C8Q71DRAFT_862706 [Rhodofomes roseus]